MAKSGGYSDMRSQYEQVVNRVWKGRGIHLREQLALSTGTFARTPGKPQLLGTLITVKSEEKEATDNGR